jgi:flagellar assembly protein FliH
MIPDEDFEAAIAHARREGFDAGFSDASTNIQARTAEALASAARELADQASRTLTLVDDMQKEHIREAVTLSATIARKLAVHLIARHPQAELAALIEESLASLEHAPHLVVRCHPDLCDAMRAAAEERMTASGFAGRLVVMGDPDIRLGDGRLEWADGGVVRDINQISGEIDKRISAYLTARSAKSN